MVHQYKNNGYNIVLDVNSGAVHVVDDAAYDVISLWETHSAEEIENCLAPVYGASQVREATDEVAALIKEEALFSKDIYEDSIANIKQRKTVVKALCLHIAHDCNLEVDFFGGEPTLNFQVVKDLVAYGREQEKIHNKNFRFTLTTNGVLLNDEIMDFANREMANVVLSIDGRKNVNDKMRPFANGSGSYDLIVPKFQKLAESRNQMNYYVRGTFTHENPDFSKDVLHLADLGFRQISIEPVVAREEDDYAIREEDLPELFEEYDRLAAEMVKRHKNGESFNFFHFMIDLEGGPCVAKRMSGCGSGTEYLAVTPWGDFYPCHQFVGNEKFCMGNVRDGITGTEISDKFKSCSVYTKAECRNCFAKFYCSGGCAANAYNFHGDINGVYEIGCALQRKRVECAIMIKAAEALATD